MIRRFILSEKGNFSVIFAIVMVPVMAAVAGAVDYTRLTNNASKLQESLDATSLALATMVDNRMTDATLQEKGAKYFTSNLSWQVIQPEEEEEEEAEPQPEEEQVQTAGIATTVSPLQVSGSLEGKEYFLTVTSTLSLPRMIGWDDWKVRRTSTVRVKADIEACVLALDPHLSKAVKIQGSTNVTMKGCVLAALSDSSDSIYRGGAAKLEAGCIYTVGGIEGFSGLSADLECDEAMEHQFPASDPLADVVPPDYGSCTQMPGGKSVNLRPGTYCNKTWSGNITLDPGIYILRGGRISLGGNGTLTGSGVTIFLMDGASFVANANQTIRLTPPSTGPYAGITLYQERGNDTALTINGTSGSLLSGFIYAPDAAVTYTGTSEIVTAGTCLRIVGDTVEMTGNSDINVDCTKELGGRAMYAGRKISLVH
jgi:hypothetical protein